MCIYVCRYGYEPRRVGLDSWANILKRSGTGFPWAVVSAVRGSVSIYLVQWAQYNIEQIQIHMCLVSTSLCLCADARARVAITRLGGQGMINERSK